MYKEEEETFPIVQYEERDVIPLLVPYTLEVGGTEFQRPLIEFSAI